MYYRIAKTKALISFAKLICVFVFAYAKSQFSQDMAHIHVTCTSCLIKLHVETGEEIRCIFDDNEVIILLISS